MSRQGRTPLPGLGGGSTQHIHIPLPCTRTSTQALETEQHTARHCYIINKVITSLPNNSRRNINKHHNNSIRSKHNLSNLHRTSKQPIQHYRNLNRTQWHPVKHKSWRRRRRANHPPVFHLSRQVSRIS